MRRSCLISQLIFITMIFCSCKSSPNIISSQNNTDEVEVSTHEAVLSSTAETEVNASIESESTVYEPGKKIRLINR